MPRNQHKEDAIQEKFSAAGQVHALIYVGDQIGDLIEVLKGFVRVGNLTDRSPGADPRPSVPRSTGKKPGTKATLDETHPVQIDGTDDNGDPL